MEPRDHLRTQSPGLYRTAWFTPRCLPSSAGLFAGKAPEIRIRKTCKQNKTSKSLRVYADGKCKKSSRICEIWGSQRSDDEGTSLGGFTPCLLVNCYRIFGVACFLLLQCPRKKKKIVFFADWKAVLFQKTGILSQVVCKFLSEEDAGLGRRSILKCVCQVINSRLLFHSSCALKSMCGEKTSLIFWRFVDLHRSVFISVFNQLDAQNLFHSKFYFMSLHVSSTCARNM